MKTSSNLKRRSLSNSEVKTLHGQIEATYSIGILHKKEKIEQAETAVNKAKTTLILLNGQPVFFFHGGSVLPTLKLLQQRNFLKNAVIDLHAVKFIIGGADVMRPGIMEMDSFEKDAVVAIVDEQNKMPIAVGIALFSSAEIHDMEKGKVIKNVHWVGDELWKLKI